MPRIDHMDFLPQEASLPGSDLRDFPFRIDHHESAAIQQSIRDNHSAPLTGTCRRTCQQRRVPFVIDRLPLAVSFGLFPTEQQLVDAECTGHASVLKSRGGWAHLPAQMVTTKNVAGHER